MALTKAATSYQLLFSISAKLFADCLQKNVCKKLQFS